MPAFTVYCQISVIAAGLNAGFFMKSVLHRRAAINSLKEKTADLILTVDHYITSLCKLFFTLYRIERNRWKELWYLAFKTWVNK